MNRKEELKRLLDDKRTGLKDSSDTNKTRYAILALFEDSNSQLLERLSEKLDNGFEEYMVKKSDVKSLIQEEVNKL